MFFNVDKLYDIFSIYLMILQNQTKMYNQIFNPNKIEKSDSEIIDNVIKYFGG